MTIKELKPCPFCGGKAERHGDTISCEFCDASVFVDQWNDRIEKSTTTCLDIAAIEQMGYDRANKQWREKIQKRIKELQKELTQLSIGYHNQTCEPFETELKIIIEELSKLLEDEK